MKTIVRVDTYLDTQTDEELTVTHYQDGTQLIIRYNKPEYGTGIHLEAQGRLIVSEVLPSSAIFVFSSDGFMPLT